MSKDEEVSRDNKESLWQCWTLDIHIQASEFKWLVWGWELFSWALLGFRIGYWAGQTQVGGEAGNRRVDTHHFLFSLSMGPQAGGGRGRAGPGLDAHFPCSSISLHKTVLSVPSLLFATFPRPAPGGTEELEEGSHYTVPPIPEVSTLLWSLPCLMQGITSGEDSPLSSMCPKPGANPPAWPTQPFQELGPGFLSLWDSPGVVGFVGGGGGGNTGPSTFSPHHVPAVSLMSSFLPTTHVHE